MAKMPHWPIPYGFKDVKLGLNRVKDILARIGNPHHNLPPVVHIAGTNGKGSTLSYLRTILELAGYKAHTYTSPHLVRFNERIRLAGTEIDDDMLYSLCEEVRLKTSDIDSTFFEATTAIAFLAMSRIPADIVLLEVGMGGRLDATNVVENTIASVITPIDFDHMEYLGNTLRDIAIEKAGIMRNNTPVVISWQYEEAQLALMEKAADHGALPYVCGRDWNFKKTDQGFDFFDHDNVFRLPNPSLYGPHQILNAATSLAVLQVLEGFNISMKNIHKGLTSTKWPARMERITSGKLYAMLPENFELWVDGAHNVAGARMIAETLKMMPAKKLIMINGRTKDRDIKGFLECFVDITQEVFCIPIYSEPKSEKPERISECAESLGFEANVSESISEAIKAIIAKYHGEDIRIVACGSLYLAGDVLEVNYLND